MTENKHGPARTADEDLVGYEDKPGSARTTDEDLVGYDDRPGSAKVVEEPTGYDHPPTDRIPVPGDLSDDRARSAERDGLPEERLEDKVEDSHAAPAEAGVGLPIEPVEPVAAPVAGPAESPADAGLFEEGQVDRFRDRWRELQAGFVDDPAQAVRGADELVDEIMRELAERRQHLEGQWRDGPGDTEELRVVIREYRAFFNQLLNA